jgi:hypothetical protein
MHYIYLWGQRMSEARNQYEASGNLLALLFNPRGKVVPVPNELSTMP